MADSSTNPYLALLQQQDTGPTWAQVLQNIGNLGFGLAGGFSQAATSGLPTMAGVGPGLMMGNQMNAQAAQAAEQDRLKRAEIGLKAQEYEDKRTEMLRKQKALEDFGKVGFAVTPQAGPLFGPNGTSTPGTSTTGTPQPGPDLKTAGAPLVDYLVAQHGLSPVAAAAVIGNLGWESPGFNTSQSHDGGRGFGLAGWDPDRTARLQAFAAAQGKPVTDLQTQLDYAVNEMKGGTDMGAARAYAGLQQAKTPEQANAALMHFFRPQGYTPANPTGGHGFDGRVANTRALLPQQRPVDPATAPVPGVGPDPDATPVPPPLSAPRPGLGPRVMPSGPAPDNSVPVAQGGDTGEVVLPPIGLPFPARAPAPAPPGSVPFPVIPAGPPQGATVMPGGTGVDPNVPPPAFMQTGPGGPAVVQPQYTPQPGQPTMTPAGGPAPAGTAPPPRPVVPMPAPDPNVVARARYGLAAGVYTAEQATNMVRQDIMDRHKQAVAEAEAQYAPQLKAWEVQKTIEAEARRQQIQIDAENRREAAKQDTWRPVTKEELQQKMPGVPPNVQFQINSKTGEIKPVDGGRHGDISSFYSAPEVQAKVNALSPVDRAAFNSAAAMGDFKSANSYLTKAATGLTEDQQQLRGDELLKTLPYGDRNVVGGLVDGTLTLTDLSKRAANGTDINRYVTLAKQVDPEWSPGVGGARRAFETKYMSGAGQGAATMLAANTAISHMRSYRDLVEAEHNTNSPIFNTAMNAAKAQFGDTNVPTAQAARILVGTEIAKAVRGAGSLGEKEEQAAQSMVNPNATPAQAQAALNMLTDFMMGRVHSIEDMAKSHGISDKTIQNYISPRSREAVEYMQKNPLGGRPAMVPKSENRPSLNSIFGGGG